jgi:uroporphyrinogen-III synthase
MDVKIRKILVSQPQPKSEKSPYFELAEKKNLKIDFRPFIHVEGVPCKEFRQQKIDILAHSAVIFTSKTAVDHYFRIAEEMRVSIPDSMKYFCLTESIAYYLQKYIVYRKRKIFYGKSNIHDLLDVILKHKDQKFLLPLSDQHKKEIPLILEKNKLNFTKAIFYRTISSDLSDLSLINYDILVFFSPSGIRSLMKNFPNFEQNETRIACFGKTTAKAVRDAGLRLDIEAPMPQAPSMTMALEYYMNQLSKNGKK